MAGRWTRMDIRAYLRQRARALARAIEYFRPYLEKRPMPDRKTIRLSGVADTRSFRPLDSSI